VVVYDISPSLGIYCMLVHAHSRMLSDFLRTPQAVLNYTQSSITNLYPPHSSVYYRLECAGKKQLILLHPKTSSSVYARYAPDRRGAYSTLLSRYEGSSTRSQLNAPRGRDQPLHPLLQNPRQLSHSSPNTLKPSMIIYRPILPRALSRPKDENFHIHSPTYLLPSKKTPSSPAHLPFFFFRIHPSISHYLLLIHLYPFAPIPPIPTYLVQHTSSPPIILISIYAHPFRSFTCINLSSIHPSHPFHS